MYFYKWHQKEENWGGYTRNRIPWSQNIKASGNSQNPKEKALFHLYRLGKEEKKVKQRNQY